MTDKSKQPTKRDGAILSLDVAIGLLNTGKEASSMTPAPAVFGVAVILLTTIRDKMVNEQDCVDLGILCANVCDALRRGTDGKKTDELSESVRTAIDRLEKSIREIQQKIDKLAKKNELVKYFTASNGKGKIAGWRLELNGILQVFDTELALNTHAIVAATHAIAIDTHQVVMKVIDGQNQAADTSIPQGELPPPPPKIFFGRSELVETIVDLTKHFKSIALTGTGGIGKTSIILTVLDDHRIKQQFGDNRLFIRCDRLIPSHTHFLRKLSEIIGAGVENPTDLSPLRRCLSSKDMIVVLDNAESILGLAETSAQEIHDIVEELSQFKNICLVITSRISNALPSHCEIIEVPTLSMEAGHETFYRIYRLGERSDQINDILKELDFHPLSIALLATVAQQNRWNPKRLITDWEKQRTGVLRARNMGSLAATIELSLASPMFQELGLDAREVIGVVAFFPQGVDEDNVDRLFPTISDGPGVFDIFCNLSLTYRGNGFIAMLAPLRDYLRPKDPMASSLLRAAKEYYFKRLLVELHPGEPEFDEAQWITSEDVNVEHLLDVFTSVDADSENVWDACCGFMDHLFWHKPRLVVLGSKVKALPDSYPSKPRCMMFLSRLFDGVGRWAERKQVLILSLGLLRERGDDYGVAEVLVDLADVNRRMDLHEEGIQQAREALKIYARLCEKREQARCLTILAQLLLHNGQIDPAGEAASCAMGLLENRDQHQLCQCHRVLATMHQSKGDGDKALHHFKASLQIASSLNSRSELFEGHSALAGLYMAGGNFNDAQIHVEQARLHTGDNKLDLGRVLFASACVLSGCSRFEEGKSEALRALAIFEELGATNLAEQTRQTIGMCDILRIFKLNVDDNKSRR